MNEAPRLRPIGVNDLAVLAQLHAQCFADPWSVAAMVELLRSPDAFGFAIEIGALPPSGFALARVVADESELLTIAVGGAWRRAGLARRLIAAVVGEARERGAKRLFLEVAEDNHAARTLYLDEAFRVVGRRRGYYTPPGSAPIDALTMRRDLTWDWRRLFGG
jgi:ribosomal-protein-alanine N-acetyltransferase